MMHGSEKDEFDDFDDFDDDFDIDDDDSITDVDVEDVEVTDADAEDDFEDDDDWGDFDDDDEDGVDQASDNPKKKKKGKGNLVVMGTLLIAIAGGGYYFMSQGGDVMTNPLTGQPIQNPAPVQMASDDANSQAAIPPSPSPIANLQDQAIADEEFVPAYQDNLDEALNEDNTFTDDVVGYTESGYFATQVFEEPETNEISADDSVLTPMPGSNDIIATDPQPTASPSFSDRFRPDSTNKPTDTAPQIPSLAQIESNSTPNIDISGSMDANIDDDMSFESPRTNEIISPVAQGQAAVNPQAQAEIDSLKTQNAALQKNLSNANAKSDALQTKIDTLTTQISKLNKDIANLRKASNNQKSAPKQQAAPAQKTSAPAASAPPKARAESRVTWTLRSAQPGSALLAQKGTSDLFNVEVGNTIPGLGTVTFIGIENGIWVVRGNKGQVTQ